MSERGTARWAEPLYLDTSALVKLFVPESDSDALNAALIGAKDVVLSDLALTELASVMGWRVRERTLTSSDAQRLYREAMKLARACRRAELTPPIHRRAERLLLTLPMSLRSLDVLHLAGAIDSGASTVVSFDLRLRDAAASQGMYVAPPF